MVRRRTASQTLELRSATTSTTISVAFVDVTDLRVLYPIELWTTYRQGARYITLL
jgi:hypothetical protein